MNLEDSVAVCVSVLVVKATTPQLTCQPWLDQTRGTRGIPGSHAASAQIPQHRTEMGKGRRQAPVRELASTQIKLGLPSHLGINSFTEPCVSLECTAFDSLEQILFLLIFYKYSVLFFK